MSGPGRRMINPPLARHPALQPLSREHFGGLVLARRLERAAAATEPAENRRRALVEFTTAWTSELAPHFADEERLLSPLISASDQFLRLIREHRAIESLAEQGIGLDGNTLPEPAWFARIGRMLHDHIRWEERVLFPAVEESLSEAQAEDLARHTARVEAERPGARRYEPKRA